MPDRRSLRVLLFCPPWRSGELYFRAQQVATHFRQQGDRVTAVAGPRGRTGLLRVVSWPWYLVRADLVFVYPHVLLPFFILSAKLFRKRVVVDHFVSYICMSEVSPRWWVGLAWLERAAYRRADAVLAHTDSVAKALQHANSLEPSRVHTVYSVVDADHFSPIYEEKSAQLRRDLGLDECFVVLYHGLWNPWHGLQTLRVAVNRLVEAGESIALVLVGRADEGAAHERLLNSVAYLELPAYIQMADVWCSGFCNLPRGDRSFSSTMIQAMAMARPVITSPSPEKEKLLRDGTNVLFVPPDDPGALAEAIHRCRSAPDYARSIGLAGRDSVQRSFGIEVFDELLKYLVLAWFG